MLETKFWLVKLGRRWIEKASREAFTYSINKYSVSIYYVLDLGIQH